MWIMTAQGWRRIVTTCTPSDEQQTSDRIQRGYMARDKDNQYAELAALVIPEKYNP